MTFTIEMLPARHGDSLWITYGDEGDPHYVLVDGGPRSSALGEVLRRRIADHADPALPGGTLDLMVVTHIDADHITGVLSLLQDRTVALAAGDVWFNAWHHLPTDLLGAKQGESLSAEILRRRLPWNVGFGGGAVMIPDDGPLPTIVLAGGMSLTFLSPTRSGLAALRPAWEREVRAAGLVPGFGAQPYEAIDLLGDEGGPLEELAGEPFEEDGSEANGASIAFLAEYRDRALLCTGDAHATVLAEALARLASQRGVTRVPVDAVKLPHHGSKHNLSTELVEALDCERYLFSTDGSIFGHPDPVTVARLVVDRPGAELVFNYRSDTTMRWDSDRLRRRHRYGTLYPDRETDGIAVEV